MGLGKVGVDAPAASCPPVWLRHTPPGCSVLPKLLPPVVQLAELSLDFLAPHEVFPVDPKPLPPPHLELEAGAFPDGLFPAPGFADCASANPGLTKAIVSPIANIKMFRLSSPLISKFPPARVM